MKATPAVIKKIKHQGFDFEWYPTPSEITTIIRADIDGMVDDGHIRGTPAVLDCGAGDGRTLEALTKGKKYAIEKAIPLIEAMDRHIYVIGADFHQQVLMDKSCDITFSNPPYSEFDAWASKIIRETSSGYVYLVLPQRWKKSPVIQEALERRSLDDDDVEVLDSFDYIHAERHANAATHMVDIIKITLTYKRNRHRCSSHYASSSVSDPFSIWFKDNFKVGENSTTCTDLKKKDKKAATFKDKKQKALVNGKTVINVLSEMYTHELNHLMNNYKSVEAIDFEILEELGVSYDAMRESVQQKISGLKNLYWRELFDSLTKITDRLTAKSREQMLSTLMSRSDVDFNSQNVYAVVIWVIKNANHYYNDQMVSYVKRMVEKANISSYKSNKRTFGDESWRYGQAPSDLEKFSLDYRVVLQRVGGIKVSEYSYERNAFKGLTESAHFFLLDTLAIASNLGFDTTGMETPSSFEWESNKGKDFYCKNHSTGKKELLMNVRAFMNGNMHIKFNQRFIKRLNIEFGRLNGWLKSKEHAADELDIPIEEVETAFNSNLQLMGSNTLQLAFDMAA